MTLKDWAWLGLGIIVSMRIILDAVTIVRVWIRSQNNTDENTDEERRKDAEPIDTPTDT